jgi:hypothetical protein
MQVFIAPRGFILTVTFQVISVLWGKVQCRSVTYILKILKKFGSPPPPFFFLSSSSPCKEYQNKIPLLIFVNVFILIGVWYLKQVADSE